MLSTQHLLAATVLSLSALAWRSSAAEPEPPKTFEAQIAYLEGALAESLRGRDLAMLEMVVRGYKASKLEGKDLELSVLRAERNAAWNNTQMYAAPNSASLETWGLMIRAKLGSTEALAKLRELSADLPPAPAPLPPVKSVKAAEYLALQAAQNAYAMSVRLHDHAIFALALLKDPGIQDRAMAAIQARKGNTDDQMRSMGIYGATDPLVLAVIEPDAEAGFGMLVAYCRDEKTSIQNQLTILSELNSLFGANNFMGAEDQFSVTSAIRKRVPKENREQLVAPLVSVLKRYEPDPKNQWDMTMNRVNNLCMALPENALPPEGVDALEALVNKLPGPKEQYPKQTFIGILKKYGKDLGTPVKPPKPPTDDSKF